MNVFNLVPNKTKFKFFFCCRPWTMDSSGENEASKDPGICQHTHQGYTEQDFEGKKLQIKFYSSNIYFFYKKKINH